jgi:hypothetical protein
MAQASSVGRVRKRYQKLRQQGMRPIQIWVPDTRAPGFAEEALRQGRLVGASYAAGGEDSEIIDFIERAFEEDFPEW